MSKELSDKLFRISLALRQATDGWCVTYETPKKTREWIEKLHSVANTAAISLEKIQDSLEERTK